MKFQDVSYNASNMLVKCRRMVWRATVKFSETFTSRVTISQGFSTSCGGTAFWCESVTWRQETEFALYSAAKSRRGMQRQPECVMLLVGRPIRTQAAYVTTHPRLQSRSTVDGWGSDSPMNQTISLFLLATILEVPYSMKVLRIPGDLVIYPCITILVTLIGILTIRCIEL